MKRKIASFVFAALFFANIPMVVSGWTWEDVTDIFWVEYGEERGKINSVVFDLPLNQDGTQSTGIISIDGTWNYDATLNLNLRPYIRIQYDSSPNDSDTSTATVSSCFFPSEGDYTLNTTLRPAIFLREYSELVQQGVGEISFLIDFGYLSYPDAVGAYIGEANEFYICDQVVFSVNLEQFRGNYDIVGTVNDEGEVTYVTPSDAIDLQLSHELISDTNGAYTYRVTSIVENTTDVTFNNLTAYFGGDSVLSLKEDIPADVFIGDLEKGERMSISWTVTTEWPETNLSAVYSVTVDVDKAAQLKKEDYIYLRAKNEFDNRLDFKKDTWNFSNSSVYFNPTGTEDYYLTEDDYGVLLSHLNHIERYWVNDLKNDEWGGSCYGMANAVILAKNGIIDSSEWYPLITGEDIHDINKAKKDDYVESIINFYHLQQYTLMVQNKAKSFMIKPVQDQLAILEDMVANVPMGESPVLLWLGNDTSGHILVAYDVEHKGDGLFDWIGWEPGYDSRVLVYDCNFPEERQYLYYNHGAETWEYKEYTQKEYTQIVLATDDVKVLDAVNYENETQNYYASLAFESDIKKYFLKLENAEEYEITPSTDLRERGIVSYYPANTIADGLSASKLFTLTLPSLSQSYSIRPASDEPFTADIMYENAILSASVEKVDSVQFSPTNEVSAIGVSGHYEMKFCANDGYCTLPWCLITISGSDARNISLQQITDGIRIEGDNLNNVTVEVSDFETTKTVVFSTDEKEVLVDSKLEGVEEIPVIKVDENDDGDFEAVLGDSPLEEESRPVPDDPVYPTYPLLVKEVSHGKVIATPVNPCSGQTVSITTTPDKGYRVGSVSVTDKNGKAVTVTNASGGKYTFKQPDSNVTIAVDFVWDNPFTDINDTEQWYYDAVEYVEVNGLMDGLPGGLFAPNKELTRAEAVQVLYNLEGKPEVSGSATFPDLVEEWYEPAIAWAESTGVVDGYEDGTFRPDQPVNRMEFAQMLYNYAVYKDYDLTAKGDLTAFPDGNQVQEWALLAMTWANGNALINGHDDGTLDPQGIAIRAQAASILMRFDQNLVRN